MIGLDGKGPQKIAIRTSVKHKLIPTLPVHQAKVQAYVAQGRDESVATKHLATLFLPGRDSNQFPRLASSPRKPRLDQSRT